MIFASWLARVHSELVTEKRREKVFKLHFGIGHSALDIAKMLDVNRNTINSDIKHLYLQIAQQSKSYDIKSLFARQMIRLDDDRAKLCKEFDLIQEHNLKLSILRSIFNIDSKVSQILLKIILDKSSFGRRMLINKQENQVSNLGP